MCYCCVCACGGPLNRVVSWGFRQAPQMNWPNNTKQQNVLERLWFCAIIVFVVIVFGFVVVSRCFWYSCVLRHSQRCKNVMKLKPKIHQVRWRYSTDAHTHTSIHVNHVLTSGWNGVSFCVRDGSSRYFIAFKHLLTHEHIITYTIEWACFPNRNTTKQQQQLK